MSRTEEKLREILQGILDQAIDYDGSKRYEGIPPDSVIAVELCAERLQKAGEALSLPTAADPIREAEEAVRCLPTFRSKECPEHVFVKLDYVLAALNGE